MEQILQEVSYFRLLDRLSIFVSPELVYKILLKFCLLGSECVSCAGSESDALRVPMPISPDDETRVVVADQTLKLG